MNRKGKILVVEDNQDNRHIIRTMLEFDGHRVIEAMDGQAGVQMARDEEPDVILMDISIPIIDGWEATALLKADDRTRHIPIIALTAHAMSSDREKAYEVGCDGFIAKPVEPRTVLNEVNRWMSEEPPARSR